MMPLTLANMGEENLIHRVGGSPEVKKHLEDLGFVAGGTVTVVAALGGNVIVKVKEARIAISEETGAHQYRNRAVHTARAVLSG